MSHCWWLYIDIDRYIDEWIMNDDNDIDYDNDDKWRFFSIDTIICRYLSVWMMMLYNYQSICMLYAIYNIYRYIIKLHCHIIYIHHNNNHNIL